MLTEDVIERYVNKDGQLITKRLISKVFGLPKLAGRFSSTRVYLMEESICDPKNNRFTAITRNLGLQRYGAVEEHVTLSISNENSNWTSFKRKAIVKFNFGAKIIQSLAIKTFEENCVRAYKGLQFVLDKMDV